MTKKSRKKTSVAEFPTPRLAVAFRYAGMLIGIAGLAIMFGHGTGRIAGPPWLRTAGLVIAIVGGVVWFLSGLPRDQAIEWIKSGLVALGLALLIRWPIAEPYRIPSGSMEPTLHGDDRIGRGDRVFVNKWVYGVRFPFLNERIYYGEKPDRWDIVVFKAVQENPRHKTLVKRIVGLPGERIQIRDGKVYADGEPLELPEIVPQDTYYTSSSPGRMPYGVRPEPEYSEVPEGHYLVMGDNSANSQDGRYFGWLPNEHIVGKVTCIWWPPTRWRDFTGFSNTWWWRVVVALVVLLLLLRVFVGRSWAALSPDGKKVDHYLVNLVAFGYRLPFTRRLLTCWGAPRRGDLVLYHPESDEVAPGTMLLGYVAGLPGERVTIDEGKLSVDGALVEDAPGLADNDYSSTHPDATYGRTRNKSHTQVPEAHYFVLTYVRHDADIPAEHEELLDSRVLGWVPRTGLTGKPVAVWWPLWRIRRAG